MRNKWYSGNGAKNPSLKLNISMYSQSLVTEGLTAPTSLNHLSTRPVHIPPHVISFSDKSLWRVWLDASGSFHTHTPFARGQFTDWDVASVSGVRMQPFPDGQMHLAQDPAPPSCLQSSAALMGQSPTPEPAQNKTLCPWPFHWGFRQTCFPSKLTLEAWGSAELHLLSCAKGSLLPPRVHDWWHLKMEGQVFPHITRPWAQVTPAVRVCSSRSGRWSGPSQPALLLCAAMPVTSSHAPL